MVSSDTEPRETETPEGDAREGDDRHREMADWPGFRTKPLPLKQSLALNLTLNLCSTIEGKRGDGGDAGMSRSL